MVSIPCTVDNSNGFFLFYSKPLQVGCVQRAYFGIFQKFLDCFSSFRNSSVCFGCFDKRSKHRNKPTFSVFGFTKQTETQPTQILFRFVSVRTENIFFSFRGHPRHRVVVLTRQPMQLGYSVPDSVPGIDSSPHSGT